MKKEGYMKIYFCVFKKHHHRTGVQIGQSCCVIAAEDEEQAREKAYELCGSDVSAFHSIVEINPSKGFTYTVYKSVM